MRTKVILEFGCNHQGEIELARQMIDEAVKLGVWGVKFQKRDLESMPEELKKKPRDMSNSFGSTYYEHRKILEFTPEQLSVLKQYAEDHGLKFVCSAFDIKSCDDLISIGCEYIKLPSQLLLTDVMEYLLTKQKSAFEIWGSTGMHDQKELLLGSNPSLVDVLFHCISVYPAPLEAANLKCIRDLLEIRQGCKVGYSSHDMEGFAISCAVSCGASYIERHYTLNKTMKGSDHGTVSSDYKEMKRILKEIECVEFVLGNERILTEPELKVRKVYRGF